MTSTRVSTAPARPRLAVTMGDPAGIGPEITAAALAGTGRAHAGSLRCAIRSALGLVRARRGQSGGSAR